MTNVVEIIDRARALMPMTRRGSTGELYQALELALRACEVCRADPAQDRALRDVIAKLPKGDKNRQYVERSSDTYSLVCRYVFFTDSRANVSRYATALREAVKQRVTSTKLQRYLRAGGVNQFYLARPLSGATISTKCLRLDRVITHHKPSSFTLTLRRKPDNSYEVLSHA